MEEKYIRELGEGRRVGVISGKINKKVKWKKEQWRGNKGGDTIR